MILLNLLDIKLFVSFIECSLTLHFIPLHTLKDHFTSLFYLWFGNPAKLWIFWRLGIGGLDFTALCNSAAHNSTAHTKDHFTSNLRLVRHSSCITKPGCEDKNVVNFQIVSNWDLNLGFCVVLILKHSLGKPLSSSISTLLQWNPSSWVMFWKLYKIASSWLLCLLLKKLGESKCYNYI